jgi:hypothetical protein
LVFSQRHRARGASLVPAAVVGISQALEWCYSGWHFGAEAFRRSSGRKVVPPDELLRRARAGH